MLSRGVKGTETAGAGELRLMTSVVLVWRFA